jgi:hypothetical protein
MFVTDPGGLSRINASALIAPQVSDEMRTRIIVWHDEQHPSAQEISGPVGCCVRTSSCEKIVRFPICGGHGTTHTNKFRCADNTCKVTFEVTIRQLVFKFLIDNCI